MADKKINPLLIFQLSDRMSDEEKYITTERICDGIRNGALIVDNKVTILSFEENGNMNYCTQKSSQ